ncbi:MAG: alanine--tRNA ligase [Phycisphaerae bacterium]|nr:alanine--tRNA ligase [Phycisphaerae bacterium]
MTRPAANEIRQRFIDYFVEKCGHTFVASSPCVPLDDPTLMFTNAGMNQFKDVFLATGTRPYTRAANTQKCIRAGGKHNDLDDVGHDTYHHTFFEMLGNWSFGDYFKKEAIEWAWDLLTNVWGLDKDRLYATYFQGEEAEGLEPDMEAAELWRSVTDIDPSHVHPGGKKDNFWEMGETGPCGPCSEIHIDLTPDKSGGKLVNTGDARVIEIWNLVFIQFNRAADGTLTPLPAKHVDTGMGFERLCAILQGVDGNYETDVFTPIFAAIRDRTSASAYTGQLEQAVGDSASRKQGVDQSRDRKGADGDAEAGSAPGRPTDVVGPAVEPLTDVRGSDSGRDPQVMRDVAYRVIADHVRCLTFALTDGATPDNEGRGYVLRRILRRAVRYGRQYLDMREPFLCDLVSSVVNTMGGAFPEIRQTASRVREIIREEEESFGKTLDRGIALFEEAAGYAVKHHHGRISGEDAFRLHDTYGFPVDLTELMAEERGLSVNIGEYERLMEQARERARSATSSKSDALQNPRWIQYLKIHTSQTKFTGYKERETDTTVSMVCVGDNLVPSPMMEQGQHGALILHSTPFYAEQGGQVGDSGAIAAPDDSWVFSVCDTQKVSDRYIHLGECTKGRIQRLRQPSPTFGPMYPSADGYSSGLAVARVDRDRRSQIKKNHTITHMMNWALREVLGDHVQQKGSLVDPDRTRFDLSHPAQITDEQLGKIEELVNKMIDEDLPVYTEEVDQAEARKINTLRAVFGEKYPDRVRAVSIGVPVADLLADPNNPEWMKYPVEFCGGTHLKHTGEVGRFRFIEESAVAKGIRRVVGVSGDRARQAEADGTALARLLKEAGRANDAALPHRITEITAVMNQTELPIVEKARMREDLAKLQARAKKAQKQADKAGVADVIAKADGLLAGAERVGDTAIICGHVGKMAVPQLRAACDSLRARAGSAAIVLAAEQSGRVLLLAAMTKDVVAKGVTAGDVIKAIAPIVGGKGGGKPDMAQGGGSDVDKIPEAMREAGAWLRARLGD